MASFSERLHQLIVQRQTPALVGIDPRWDWLPEALRTAALARSGSLAEQQAWAFEQFSMQLIEIVAPLVPAVKPQVAFFEQLGPAGLIALRNIMLAARRQGIVVIADAKRGDIGSTAEAYAEAWLAGADPDRAAWPADALTVNPYLGRDSLEPFVKLSVERVAGVYVLVKTSNPGSASFQSQMIQGQPLSSLVAKTVQQMSAATTSNSGYGCVGAVVGATWPEELRELRHAMPSVPLLIPGYGSQGGSAADVESAFDSRGLGALINSSRAINFAWRSARYAERFGEQRWQDAVHAATLDMIAELRTVCAVEQSPAA